MDDEAILGHLLKIENEAAALVNEAQAEADRRVAGGEKQSRAAYEERYRAEVLRFETEFKNEKEIIKQRYQQELASYKEKLSSIKTDTGRFCAALDGLIEGEA